jgi:hypothetical protein
VYKSSTIANTQHYTMAQSARKIVVAVDFGQSDRTMALACGLRMIAGTTFSSMAFALSDSRDVSVDFPFELYITKGLT